MARAVLTREAYLDRWQTLHGGYDPRGSKLVGPWLSVVYGVARPFARAGIPPDVVTLLGVVVSGLVVWLCWLGGRWVILAAVVVGLSGLLDSIDGAVAVLTDRVTRWGAVLDSVVDRVSDVLYLVALWLVGAPAWVCVVAGVLLFTQEYARARATASRTRTRRRKTGERRWPLLRHSRRRARASPTAANHTSTPFRSSRSRPVWQRPATPQCRSRHPRLRRRPRRSASITTC